MAAVVFTKNLERHVECPTAEVEGATVREVLDWVFASVHRSGAIALIARFSIVAFQLCLVDIRRRLCVGA